MLAAVVPLSSSLSPVATRARTARQLVSSFPTTLVADESISPIFLASATGATVAVLLVVAAIVVNFGIRK